MKIITQTQDVESHGMLAQRQFTVNAGAHIMAVLSGLYKNPIDAMVREYLTNMFDAYVALEREQPGAVITAPVLHLPSALDGNLTFRDFGIGMSMETVWNVYATYGASTKSNSNDEVGGFGLGSKTAFCYNGGASWTIESRHEGMKHVFMAFIGEDSVPNLTHVSSMPTNEHSGVTIAIPIRREDHRECIVAAQKYVPYFPMDITVEGATIPAIQYILRDTRWGIRERTPTRTHTVTARVIMGNVPYAIEQPETMVGKIADVNQYELREFILNNTFDLFVDIGAVDIVPSRDSMKYTDRTKAAILAAITILLQEIGTVTSKMLTVCDTEWEALTALRDIHCVQNVTSVIKQLTWRGNPLNIHGITREVAPLIAKDPAAIVTAYVVSDTHRASIDVFQPTNMVIGNTTSFVIIDDLVKGGGMMARAFVDSQLVSRNHSGRAARYGHKVGKAYLIKTSLSKKALGEWFGGMPADLILTTSELKGTVKVPNSLKDIKDTIYRWSGQSWSARVTIPTGTTMYYLPLTKDDQTKRFSFITNRYGSQKDAVALITKHAEMLGIAGTKDPLVWPIYGIKETDVGNFDATWVNLVDAMESVMKAKIVSEARTFALSFVQLPPEVQALKSFLIQSDVTNACPAMKAFINAFYEIENAKNSDCIRSYNVLHTKIPSLTETVAEYAKKETVPDIAMMQRMLAKKYPMISILADAMSNLHQNHYRRDEFTKNSLPQVLAYMKLVG